MQKTLILDAHVHIYPNFDLAAAVRRSVKNLAALGQKEARNVWLLTERSDCNFFENRTSDHLDEYQLETLNDRLLVVIDKAEKPVLYILAGRQIISSDNLEVCALCTAYSQPDKQRSTLETINAVNDAGGLAALNWAPGKWFGRRGAIVQQVFETVPPQQLFISDTTMRPTLWRTPKLMAAAQKRGFRVLFGSDPLPFQGEESLISSYATRLFGDFDDNKPEESIRSLLQSGQQWPAIGRRSGSFTFLKRQLKIMAAKKG